MTSRFANTLKVFVWRLIFTPYYRLSFRSSAGMRRSLHILDSEDTILYIIQNRCSVSRFGDGEFQMISHYLSNGTADDFHVDSFQNYDPDLASRLLEVYLSAQPGHLVCIPYAFRKSSVYKGYSRTFFEREFLFRKDFLCSGNDERLMGDSCFTRFYLNRRDILDHHKYVSLLKKIWDNRKILIVEGASSRLGIGNDLFDNAFSVRRILCPATDAYARYDEISAAVRKEENDSLVLIALGHTATVLAYDLGKYGYQSIDIGHIDIEYEWMRMKARKKVAVPNKYVNEVSSGRIVQEIHDKDYESQIICRIC